MSSVLLKRCTACKEYTLREACPRCGAKATPNRPAKFSPEDNFGAYRRKLKKLDKAKGPGNSDSERVAGAQAAAPAAKPRAQAAERAQPAEKARAGFSAGSTSPAVGRAKPGKGA